VYRLTLPPYATASDCIPKQIPSRGKVVVRMRSRANPISCEAKSIGPCESREVRFQSDEDIDR